MTREEAIKQLRLLKGDITFGIASKVENKNQIEALSIAIASLETDEMYDLLYEEPEFCADCISKADALKLNVYAPIAPIVEGENVHWEEIILTEELRKLPSVLPDVDDNNVGELTIHCKDCKFFEYDHFENVFGVQLIVAHEVCTKWGEACKTDENGACFLAERKEAADET